MSPGLLSWPTLTTCSSTPSSDQKGPLGSRAPWLCQGTHFPPVWSFSLAPPSESPEAPTTQGKLSAVSWEGLCGVKWKKQEVPVGPPTHNTVASTRLLTASLWMGPGWVQGPHCMSWFSSHPSAAYTGVSH